MMKKLFALPFICSPAGQGEPGLRLLDAVGEEVEGHLREAPHVLLAGGVQRFHEDPALDGPGDLG